MKYTLAFAAAVTGAFAATSKPFVPGYGVESSAAPSTTAAPVTTPAPAGPETSTVFQTEVDTIFSCGPEVTSCPYRSTTSEAPKTTSVAPPPPPPATTSVEIKTTAPATSIPKTSTAVSTEVVHSTEQIHSTVVLSSTPAASTTSEAPKTTSVAPPPPPPVTFVSTSIQVEQCTPSTITHYVTIVSQPVESKMTPIVQTTPLATSKPFGTAPGYGMATGSVAMKPTPSTVNPPIATGAAVANSVQLSGVAVAFAAYLLF